MKKHLFSVMALGLAVLAVPIAAAIPAPAYNSIDLIFGAGDSAAVNLVVTALVALIVLAATAASRNDGRSPAHRAFAMLNSLVGSPRSPRLVEPG